MFVFVLLVGLWSTFFPGKNLTPAEELASDSAQWKTYTNKKLNYSLQYPGTLELSEVTAYSTTFMTKSKPLGGLVFPTLYISVIPDNFNGDQENIFNFMPADVINNFYTMRDNETQQTQTGFGSEYWIFKKIGTIQIAGIDGVIVENSNIIEGPGLVNRRIIIKKGGFTYLFGSYYNTQEELTALQKFILSFNFLK